MEQDQRNLLIALGLMLLVFVGWDALFLEPYRRDLEAVQKIEAQAPQRPAEIRPPKIQTRSEILTQQRRIAINGPALGGSIALNENLRLDDLVLKRHFVTLDKTDPVILLIPQGAEHAAYAEQSWTGLPQSEAGQNWQLVSGSELTPDTPLELIQTGPGWRLTRHLSMDENYLFTLKDTLTNTGSGPLKVAPSGLVRQYGLPADWHNFAILHEGVIGALNEHLKLLAFKKLQKGKTLSDLGEGGWIGLTSKYWMNVLIPDQKEPVSFTALAHAGVNNTRVFEARYQGAERIIASGDSTHYQGHVFAGAKRLSLLKAYGEQLNLSRFSDAVDWGNFWFFTKPIFWALSLFNGWMGNFGFAILALTVVIKLGFVPMQNSAYAAMAQMRKLMPEMEKIRERFAADPQRQQLEIMGLYKREKVNPLAGCLPLIPQMFVFYALYKTLFVTLEMRHEPFIGWIRDLSAPDPLMPLNLFGLLPWDPSSVPLIGGLLGIGTWPVLYGLTMWMLQSLSPPPPDPTQRAILKFFPLLFTFIFAGFAAGLVIYWTWSNILSTIQQYWIMRRHGVETRFDTWLARFRQSTPPDT